MYPGLRQTGWAVIRPPEDAGQVSPSVAASGVADLRIARKLDPAERITGHLRELGAVYSRWRPAALVCSRSGGLGHRASGARLLVDALQRWADGHALSVIAYPVSEVRTAMAGKPNASKDALAYAVMQHCRLIGENLADSEWEAIAVGCHHLQRISKGDLHTGPAG